MVVCQSACSSVVCCVDGRPNERVEKKSAVERKKKYIGIEFV